MPASRETKPNSDPLASSVQLIITPAVSLPRVKHVFKSLSRQDYFSGLIEFHLRGSNIE